MLTESEIRTAIADGETMDVEFKGEEKRPLNDGELVEAVVCIANRSGDRPGHILVGVEDDGRITGARPRHEAGITDTLRVQALISNRTRPSLTVHAALVALDGKTILVIEVPTVRQPVGTTDGKYVRRAMGGDHRPACLPFHFHEMQSLQSSRGLLDYSAVTVPEATWQDLDPLEFERFRRRIRDGQGRGDPSLKDLPDMELAKALGAVEANGEVRTVRVLGLLLFGREEALRRHMPTHEAAFQVLHGTEVKVNDFFRWPLIQIMEEFESRFRARNQEAELMVGMMRVGVPDYPEQATREAVVNAFIHRDYTRLGAVHIQCHDHQMEISNPGGFPEGVSLDNLLVTSPKPRNPLLADAFKRAGIVERTARGIDMIFYSFLRNGCPLPDYHRSGETSVVVILRGGQPDLKWVRFAVEEGRSKPDFDLQEMLLLRAAAENTVLDVATACQTIQTSEKMAMEVLSRLMAWEFLEKREGSNHYHLTRTVLRRLGLKQPDRRLVHTTLNDIEQAILNHVEKHGQITRMLVAKEYGLSEDQAKRLLGRLASRGLLVRLGAGRSVQYGRARNIRAVARLNGRSPDKADVPKTDRNTSTMADAARSKAGGAVDNARERKSFVRERKYVRLSVKANKPRPSTPKKNRRHK